MIPVLKIPVQKDYSKSGGNVQNTVIANRSGDYGNSGQRSHKKLEHQFPGLFLSNILLVKKKEGVGAGKGGGRNLPCINLKALNNFIPYKHFKMEGLHCLKYLLEKNDLLCKIYLKDAYLSVPPCLSSRKLVTFACLGNLYEFLHFCFGLGSAPRIFLKLLKVFFSMLNIYSH